MLGNFSIQLKNYRNCSSANIRLINLTGDEKKHSVPNIYQPKQTMVSRAINQKCLIDTCQRVKLK